jgi:hypothetical protein
MALANTLVYYDTATITAVINFIIKASCGASSVKHFMVVINATAYHATMFVTVSLSHPKAVFLVVCNPSMNDL